MLTNLSIVDLLRARTDLHPDRTAFTYLVDGEREEEGITYKTLDDRARRTAACLQQQRLSEKPVLLLFQSGLDFIVGFMGCLYAGVLAVPVYLPHRNRSLSRLEAIVADAQPAGILTSKDIYTRYEHHLPLDLAPEQWIVLSTAEATEATAWIPPELASETIAFLQYTSGSTSMPKGVVITHGNISHNQRIIQRGFQHQEGLKAVGWLPLFHDMGLIGNVIQTLFVGGHTVLMSPTSFMQRPISWLQAISRYRAETSGGPNFAYELCVRKATDADKETLDLSSWKVAFNGAEPVRADTLDRFVAAFAPSGFRREAFYPCYGLAEATLMVSGGAAMEAPRVITVQPESLTQQGIGVTAVDGNRIVGCGNGSFEQQLVIVNPKTHRRCSSGTVGEIWVSGPSVANGYWNHAKMTTDTFRAFLADTNEGPFLRTGDLGFFNEGELFVTGRLKDLIILRGRNFYPQDIETVVLQAHPALRPEGAAAVSVEASGESRLVVLHEVRRVSLSNLDVEGVARAIREVVSKVFEVQVYGVVLLMPGGLPRTSSGKIQRYLCRKIFLEDTPKEIGRTVWGNDIPLESATSPILREGAEEPCVKSSLCLWAAQILGVEVTNIQPRDSLVAHGLDSLAALEFTHRVEQTFGFSPDLNVLLGGASLAEIIAKCEAYLAHPPAESATTSATKIKRILPLAPGQQALWLHHQLEPDTAIYNISAEIHLRGPLDVALLRQSLQELFDRHESLRAHFIQDAGRPQQQIRDHVEVPLEIVDTSTWEASRLEKETAATVQTLFDLSYAPLVRLRLFSSTAQEHLLVMVAHHSMVDLSSVKILLSELSTLYLAAKESRAPQLPSRVGYYSDFVYEQQSHQTSAIYENHRSYWTQQLVDVPALLTLPVARSRSLDQSYDGAVKHFSLDAALSYRLKELARREGVTCYTVLLAAFSVLLHRYSGQQDFVVGTPVTQRTKATFREVVGYLVNPVALRVRFALGTTFRDMLQNVQQTALGALQHSTYPFGQVIADMHPERDPSYPPLVQVMFNMISSRDPEMTAMVLGIPGTSLKVADLLLEAVPLEQQPAPFELMLTMSDSGGCLTGNFLYRTALFDEDTIRQLWQHFRRILESVLDEPDTPIDLIPLLSAEEQQRWLIAINRTERPYPFDRPLHALVTERAKRHGSAIAIQDATQEMSYSLLEQRTNQLARYLQKSGVRAESRVAILLTRSVHLGTALLAVLKSGGCYVPLDPFLPPQRLQYVLDDAAATILLTEEALLDHVPKTNTNIIVLEHEEAAISKESTKPLPESVRPEQVAYVIYTSGSTGRPKGVVIAHHALVNYLHAVQEWARLGAADRFLAVTTLSFDIAVTEFFLPWLVGAQVIVASDDEVENAALLAQRLDQSRATIVQTTPSRWRVLRSFLEESALPPVMLSGGEALPRTLAQALLTPNRRLLNMYGPTETTVWSTAHEVCSGDGAVPIGLPIANTQVYVLDAALQPLPPGVPGQLYIGGSGLARGYLARPTLTATSFVPNPFSERPGARLYRTGDRVRWRADGRLEFLGRLDQQIKHHGYRVELGEVEAVLREQKDVAEAVVVYQKEGTENAYLAGYVVPHQGKKLSEGLLRQWMRSRLPRYMEPQELIVLESLPKTSNGKVDRRQLPQAKKHNRENSSVLPQTALEQVLCELWKEVLEVESVGLEDDFFALGGHSLLAMQIVLRTQETLGISIPVRTLFVHPTIAEMRDAMLLQTENKERLETVARVLLRVIRMTDSEVSAQIGNYH